MKTPETLAHCWLAMRERPASATAVRVKRGDSWKDISWDEYARDIELAAAGLLSLGVRPGDRVAIMSETRYEWACADFAVMCVGAVTVPVYANNTPEDCAYILNDSGARVLFIENRASGRAWRKISGDCPSVEKTVCFEKNAAGDDDLAWESLLEEGRSRLRADPGAVTRLAAARRADDFATLIYTSGTTGRPKGVVLRHEQGVSEVSDAFTYVGVTAQDVSLSFLPYAHVLGRIEMWGHAWIGFTMAFAESIEKVRANLQDIRPTILVAVPRIFEKIHAGIHTQMENQLVKKKLFDWAIDVGQQVGELRMTRQIIPLSLLARYEAARRLVLDRIKDAFGGRLRFAISGGAPLAEEISRFFHAAGVLILEGYGMTETTAAITVNAPFNYRFGSVGRPLPEVRLRIAADGEVLVKSKKVTREYYKNPEATAAVLKDGWFHTGDIGHLLPGGDLRITDRKKDLIKTAGGKYVAPQRIEGLLKMNPLVSHVLVHGDQRKYVVALLSPDRAALEKFARDQGIAFREWTELLKNPKVLDQFRQGVAQANERLASFESVKRFAVLPVEFSVEGGELTPSLKVKRKVLDERFRDRIEALYS
ncbi:MAG: long-chain fatty acid--CoA ligase [Bdellovibrionaceae bacterium]|nr:long-chain fatty acid--CoA ligase [Pseudobdellovibrionaceae bacterium]MBX3032529.1 long-chain fatty acid--CoA ligase [Pseudobdellovibrionaceae bacterium]